MIVRSRPSISSEKIRASIAKRESLRELDGDVQLFVRQASLNNQDDADADKRTSQEWTEPAVRKASVQRSDHRRKTAMLEVAKNSGTLGDLLTGSCFQAFMAVVIVTNAIVIGLEVDMPELDIWNAVELTFLIVFTSELLLRLKVFGPSIYFSQENPDLMWNVFDAAVVASGVFGTIAEHLQLMSGASGEVATLLRVIRLLRVFRIFRVVRFLKQLYMLVYGFGIAALATLWVTILTVVILYVLAVVAIRVADTVPEADEDYDFIQGQFSKVGESMVNLFSLMLSGSLEEYDNMLGKYAQVAIFVVGFMVFGNYGLLAVLSGVITEAMFNKNQMKMEEERHDRDMHRKMLSLVSGELFEELISENGVVADQRGSGGFAMELSVESVLKQTEMMAAFLNKKGISVTEGDLEDVLKYADCDDSGFINKTEFEYAMIFISPDATAGSIVELSQIISSNAQSNTNMVDGLIDAVTTQDKKMADSLSYMDGKINGLANKLDDALNVAACRVASQATTGNTNLHGGSDDVITSSRLASSVDSCEAIIVRTIHLNHCDLTDL